MRNAIVVLVGSARLSRLLLHDTRNSALTRVVRGGSEVPRAETVVQLVEITQRGISRARRIVTLVDFPADRETVFLRRRAHELPQAGRLYRRLRRRIEAGLDHREVDQSLRHVAISEL